jgi:Zn-dependent M28 family amino/carboxypeptidase
MDDQLQARLRLHVQRIAARPRPPETNEHQAVRGYITRQLEDAGFNVRVAAHEEADVPCLNVLTDPLPADERLPLVIVGAHYDSITDSPGADDNASAVAALLELGRFIRPHLENAASCQARLQLVAYDLEEYGLVGSGIHAREVQQAQTQLLGMLALEMLGYADSRPGTQLMPPPLKGMYPNVGNFIGIVGNEASADLLRAAAAGMKSIDGLPVELIAVPGDGRLLGETRLSDHSSFWDQGFPAVMITDTSFFRNPHYHKASDTAETLDYDFLAKVTAGVCAAVLRLLRN